MRFPELLCGHDVQRGSCKTAQRSTRITEKLKSVPETFRSIRNNDYDEKKKKFPVFNKIKNGDPVKF